MYINMHVVMIKTTVCNVADEPFGNRNAQMRLKLSLKWFARTMKIKDDRIRFTPQFQGNTTSNPRVSLPSHM